VTPAKRIYGNILAPLAVDLRSQTADIEHSARRWNGHCDSDSTCQSYYIRFMASRDAASSDSADPMVAAGALRVEAAMQLRAMAWEVAAAGMRDRHPDWSPAEVEAAVLDAMRHATT
jgi:hypothetical protein